MEVAGLCGSCGKSGAMFSCALCGKAVCKDCITLSGACKKCAGGRNIVEDRDTVDRIMRDKGLR